VKLIRNKGEGGDEGLLTGIILAGGDHQRMGGENRALLPIGGELLVHRQIHEMGKICDEIIIVTNEPRPFLRVIDPSVRIITDFYPGKGPLGGMHAGLSLMVNDTAWVAACDMPFLSSGAAEVMKRFMDDFGFDAVVPRIGGRLEMLHGLYGKKTADSIRLLLNTGDHRLEQLLHFLRWSDMDNDQFAAHGIDGSFVTTIKTRDDYEKMLLTVNRSAK
jgi:molybdopterin-guanine dinucleotide biosynthesis protein A